MAHESFQVARRQNHDARIPLHPRTKTSQVSHPGRQALQHNLNGRWCGCQRRGRHPASCVDGKRNSKFFFQAPQILLRLLMSSIPSGLPIPAFFESIEGSLSSKVQISKFTICSEPCPDLFFLAHSAEQSHCNSR